MRAQKRAVSAWRERYISVNADSQSAAASVIEKSVTEMDETRRTRTLAPKASISSAVKAVGTAYAEKLYAAGSVKAMVIWTLVIVRDAEAKSRAATVYGGMSLWMRVAGCLAVGRSPK